MDFSVIDLEVVVTLLLLLLIGIGPKIALVPFLEKTKEFPPEQQRAIGRRMVKTAVVAAVVVFFTGAFLLRLLHITPGAVAVAGGIILALLAVKMALGPGDEVVHVAAAPADPDKLAVYPLAVPYLFNPVGITVLIIASESAESIAASALVLGLVLLVGRARLPHLQQHRQGRQADEPDHAGGLGDRLRRAADGGRGPALRLRPRGSSASWKPPQRRTRTHRAGTLTKVAATVNATWLSKQITAR